MRTRTSPPSPRLAPRPLALPLLACAAAAILAPRSAHAGGFEIPDHGARALGRGGAFAVGASDLTAAHYNPATMAKFRGTRVMLSHTSIFQRISYERATLGDNWVEAGTEFDRVEDRQRAFLLGGFGVVSSDFGLDHTTFYAAVFGPSASGKHDFPAYGPQSLMLTSMDVVQVFYHLGAAWEYDSPTQGRPIFGLGGSLAYAPLLKMDYGLVVDSAAPLPNGPTNSQHFRPVPQDTGTQLESTLKLRDLSGFSANLGAWVRPILPLEIGVGARLPTVYQPKGSIEVDSDALEGDVSATMDRLVTPAMLRGGVRFIGIDPKRPTGPERFDVELDVVWENWSQVDAYDLSFTGAINGNPLEPISMQKAWVDTLSLRLGGDLVVLPEHLSVRAGGFWESGATPEAYAHLDFPSFMRGGVGGGLTGGIPGAMFTLGYQHVFQAAADNSELSSKVFQQRPLEPCPDACNDFPGVPANAGTMRASYDMLGLSVDLNFSELRGRKREPKRKGGSGAEAPSPEAGRAPAGAAG